ncbi:MAG TPA: type II toxin-antitoxin system RelE/ParE family toxin [Isosphaeraceae bacterium]|jgi:plasmid stabilization system protein ParE|nr:type II toxin-antitoxin system RelE/ParE family toxin [Isosphaeraceae bacterium]
MARLTWSPRAAQDLEDICEYIGRGSEHYARVFARQVVSLVEAIPEQPQAGSIVPEYDRRDLRERVFHNYRIIYRVRGEVVEIVSICHGARLLPPEPPG